MKSKIKKRLIKNALTKDWDYKNDRDKELQKRYDKTNNVIRIIEQPKSKPVSKPRISGIFHIGCKEDKELVWRFNMLINKE